MPQYLIHPKHPIRTFVYIVLALGLVVGGFLTYKDFRISTEFRSKAALEYRTFANWEFGGTDTEGWTAKAMSSITVSKGLLTAKAKPTNTSNPLLEYKKLVDLPIGNKYFIIRINILPPFSTNPKPIPINQNYSILFDYKIVNGAKRIKPLILNGIANGQWEDLYVKLPDIDKVSIEDITLSFAGLKTDALISIDWIRFTDKIPPIPTKPPTPSIHPTPVCVPMPEGCNVVGVVCDPKPGERFCPVTPTPTICSVSLSNYDVKTPCENGNYRYVYYSCSNGFIGQLGGPTSCKSTSEWKTAAEDACKARSCDETPIPPTPTFTPALTPTPTPTYPQPSVTSISSQNWTTGDSVTIYGNYLLQPKILVSTYKVYYRTPTTSSLYAVASILPNQNNTEWEQTAIRFTVPHLPSSSGSLVIMWGSPASALALPYNITINP